VSIPKFYFSILQPSHHLLHRHWTNEWTKRKKTSHSLLWERERERERDSAVRGRATTNSHLLPRFPRQRDVGDSCDFLPCRTAGDDRRGWCSGRACACVRACVRAWGECEVRGPRVWMNRDTRSCTHARTHARTHAGGTRLAQCDGGRQRHNGTPSYWDSMWLQVNQLEPKASGTKAVHFPENNDKCGPRWEIVSKNRSSWNLSETSALMAQVSSKIIIEASENNWKNPSDVLTCLDSYTIFLIIILTI